MNIKEIGNLIKTTFKQWSDDQASSYAAALAYYTIFSLGPLLIICVAVASVFIDKNVFQGQIIHQFGGMIGPGGAEQIRTILENTNKPADDIKTMVIGIVVLVFGASGLFSQLQLGLNAIWHVKLKPDQGIFRVIKTRILSFSMVLVVAFFLLVTSVLSVLISAFSAYLTTFLPESTVKVLLLLDFSLSLGVVTLLFAMIFKILPDVDVHWSNVWLGAFVTAVLFILGKTLLGVYFSKSNIGGPFGAAGSLIIILVWFFYSAQILFLGAEFTKIYTTRKNPKLIKPYKYAMYY